MDNAPGKVRAYNAMAAAKGLRLAELADICDEAHYNPAFFKSLGPIDLLASAIPCKDFSAAGTGAGVTAPRTGSFLCSSAGSGSRGPRWSCSSVSSSSPWPARRSARETRRPERVAQRRRRARQPPRRQLRVEAGAEQVRWRLALAQSVRARCRARTGRFPAGTRTKPSAWTSSACSRRCVPTATTAALAHSRRTSGSPCAASA